MLKFINFGLGTSTTNSIGKKQKIVCFWGNVFKVHCTKPDERKRTRSASISCESSLTKFSNLASSSSRERIIADDLDWLGVVLDDGDELGAGFVFVVVVCFGAAVDVFVDFVDLLVVGVGSLLLNLIVGGVVGLVFDGVDFVFEVFSEGDDELDAFFVFFVVVGFEVDFDVSISLLVDAFPVVGVGILLLILIVGAVVGLAFEDVDWLTVAFGELFALAVVVGFEVDVVVFTDFVDVDFDVLVVVFTLFVVGFIGFVARVGVGILLLNLIVGAVAGLVFDGVGWLGVVFEVLVEDDEELNGFFVFVVVIGFDVEVDVFVDIVDLLFGVVCVGHLLLILIVGAVVGLVVAFFVAFVWLWPLEVLLLVGSLVVAGTEDAASGDNGVHDGNFCAQTESFYQIILKKFWASIYMKTRCLSIMVTNEWRR